MSSKANVEVVIGGKVLTICGYESEDYLQKVASYINNKLNEYSKLDGFKRQSLEMQNVLMQINLADDYFKAKSEIARMEDEVAAKDKELYDMKHELISLQIKMENLDKANKELQKEVNEQSKKIIRLENIN